MLKAKTKVKQPKVEEKTHKVGLFKIGAGNLFASMIISGLFLGYLVDSLFDTSPIFMLSLGLLGFIGGMKKVHDMLSFERKE